MGNLNHPETCWRDNTAGHKQFRRFLEGVDANFLLQAVEKPMRRGALLSLVLANNAGHVGNMQISGSLGCSDHEMLEFKICRPVKRVNS